MTAILRARAPPDREVQTKNIDRYDTALFFPETKQAEIKAIVASARGWLPKVFDPRRWIDLIFWQIAAADKLHLSIVKARDGFYIIVNENQRISYGLMNSTMSAC